MVACVKPVDVECPINTRIYHRRSRRVAPAEQDVVEVKGEKG